MSDYPAGPRTESCLSITPILDRTFFLNRWRVYNWVAYEVIWRSRDHMGLDSRVEYERECVSVYKKEEDALRVLALREQGDYTAT